MTALEKLTTWMREQVGTKESGENNVIYNTHYYGREVQGEQYPWCMAFIWDGFRTCGLSPLLMDGDKSAYCPFVATWAKQHGLWVSGEYRTGDLLFYDWNWDGIVDHVGFCIGQNGQYLEVVEGNVGDAVTLVRRLPGIVMGAYRPHYGSEDVGGPAPAEDEECDAPVGIRVVSRGDVSGATLSAQILLIHKWSISCGPDGADGDYGPNTEAAVKAFQRHYGLEADGVIGPLTWSKLIN